MAIKVRFFASLRQQQGTAGTTIGFEQGVTAADVWRLSTGSATLPANTHCAINLQHAAMHTPVRDGDEVAFFPPVTGG